MSNISKADAIVKDLLENPNLYRQKSQQEGEVWGKYFSNNNFNELQQKDRQAAAKLKFNRHNLNFIPLLRENCQSANIGLSLACGNGRAERSVLQRGICNKFHGIDIADEALAKAKKIAKEQNLDIVYRQGDLNSIELPANTYDLVITQNCLHHVLQLEYLAEEIAKSMTPNGVLWIHDYIGETQFLT